MLLIGAGAALVISADPAMAISGQGQVAQRLWLSSDVCNREAVKNFPDVSQESLTKRDAYVRKCLRDNRLPQREALLPKQ